MTLHIGATPYSSWQQLGPLLHQLGYSGSLDASEEAQIPDQDATNRDPGPYLLLHTRPERAIAHALDAGKDPEEALALWRDAAERLLAFYRHHRRQAVMVEALDAAQYPNRLLDWLNQNHHAFQGSSQPSQEVQSIPAQERPSELNLLIASQLVAQNTQLKPLLVQIEACSVPLVDNHYCPPQVNTLDVHQQVREHRNGREEPSACKSNLDEHGKRLDDAQPEQKQTEKNLEEENELLFTQLHKVQEELESYYHKHQDGAQTNDELNGVLKALETNNQRLTSDLKATEDAKARAEAAEQDLKEENELILNQLFQVQEELEKYYLANARTEQELTDVKKEHQEQTLPKLFQTQEELEQAVNRVEELVRELDQLTDKVDYLNDQIDTKNEKLRRLSDEKKQLKVRLKLAQEALNHKPAGMGFSALTKMANPLRKLRRAHRLAEQQIRVVEESDLFDRNWYAEQNPDVAARFTNLAEHYVRHGGQEGRDPSPHFSTNGYLENNPDVADSGLNPLAHYLMHGKEEGRSAS